MLQLNPSFTQNSLHSGHWFRHMAVMLRLWWHIDLRARFVTSSWTVSVWSCSWCFRVPLCSLSKPQLFSKVLVNFASMAIGVELACELSEVVFSAFFPSLVAGAALLHSVIVVDNLATSCGADHNLVIYFTKTLATILLHFTSNYY